MTLVEDDLKQIPWVEIERHQIGKAFDFGEFTMECISRKKLDGERTMFVLSRVDGNEGTYFQLEYLTVRPDVSPNDPRIKDLVGMGHQPNHILAKLRLDDNNAVCTEEGRVVNLYNGQELAHQFQSDMRNSLKERGAGIKPDGAEKIMK